MICRAIVTTRASAHALGAGFQRRFPLIRAVVMLCLVGVSGPFRADLSAAQVVLSEVMFDPAGSQLYDEFVEVQNIGDEPIDLSGWRVGDLDEADFIVSNGDGTVLAPGAFGLILDAGYVVRSGAYDPLPETALVLTVDSQTLGRDGLSSLHPETIVLVDAAGDTVGRFTYRAGNSLGRSEEKVDPHGGDGPENWADARWDGGSPGRTNSVSRKAIDVALAPAEGWTVDEPFGETGGFQVLVVNVGLSPVSAAEIRVIDGSSAEVWKGSVPVLLPNDSTRVEVPVPQREAGIHRYRAHISLFGDQDPINDGVTWQVVYGAAAGSVVINEVMSSVPQGATEWVELWNRAGQPIDLTKWSLQDSRPSSATVFSDGGYILPSGGFLVLCEDELALRADFPEMAGPVLQVDGWPRLNDTGDAVVLKDGTETDVDRVAFGSGSEPGRSLERIDPNESGEWEANWLGSTHPERATPGSQNTVALPEHLGPVRVTASPNPFVNQVDIIYRLPVRRARVHLWIYDRLGRRVRVVAQGEEGGAQRRLIWNGRDDRGGPLKPGVYIVYLEAGAPDGRVLQHRTTVVLAAGL